MSNCNACHTEPQLEFCNTYVCILTETLKSVGIYMYMKQIETKNVENTKKPKLYFSCWFGLIGHKKGCRTIQIKVSNLN